MAVYKIFPEKSATLYSYYPTLNSGLDEILELSLYETIGGTYEVSRPILKFPTNEINNIINNKVSSSNYDVYLKLYLADASDVPLDYTIFCHPLAADWNIGTGRSSNSPITTDGVSWQYKNFINGNIWFSAGNFPAGTTGSYNINSTVGGGLWWTSSLYESTQSFIHSDKLDIELKVTNIVDAWYSSSISNYGFILKHSNLLEFNTSSYFETKYFSGNTHTIYPACLEIRWDDYYNSSSLSTVSTQDIVVTLGNNQSEYQQGSIQRFRVNVRDKYPARIFQTSSLYLNNKILPTTSYYQIKDLDTEEIIIDFDTTYTKLSADDISNYFDIYLSGMEPERYYKILIKTNINGSTLIFDNDYFFKVIR